MNPTQGMFQGKFFELGSVIAQKDVDNRNFCLLLIGSYGSGFHNSRFGILSLFRIRKNFTEQFLHLLLGHFPVIGQLHNLVDDLLGYFEI